MTTAATIINQALEYIGVSSVLAPANGNQQSRAFDVLKELFDSLPCDSIYLQMQRPATTSADLREPLYAKGALVKILGYELLPYFRKRAEAIDIKMYDEAKTMLQNKTRRPIRTSYDRTVPGQHYYIGDTKYQYTLYDERKEGEVKVYTMDFTSEASQRNTTVSSVSWSNIGSVNATISGEALSGSIATATATFTLSGHVTLQARATFANGEIYDGIFNIDVIDPESIYRDADYG